MSKQVERQFFGIYKSFFPPESVSFVEKLYDSGDFNFHVCRPRKTKKGDFRYFRYANQPPIITVNSDLCAYEFLLVYLHEVAHYLVYKKHSRPKNPHGREWKKEYISLITNLLDQVVLPESVKEAFAQHVRCPKASSGIDVALESLFHSMRSVEVGLLLKELPEGSLFSFRCERFRLLHHNRTRACCLRLSNGRQYLIHGTASVSRL